LFIVSTETKHLKQSRASNTWKILPVTLVVIIIIIIIIIIKEEEKACDKRHTHNNNLEQEVLWAYNIGCELTRYAQT
jgi:nucleoside recognition membrane protein YjiH